MGNNLTPIGNADVWWLRYGLGIAATIGFVAWGLDSIISQHSYAIWGGIRARISFVPVHGEQAVLMGVASLGVALWCFSQGYAQYHEKMGWYYQWPKAAGVLIAGAGVLWCGWLFLFP